MSLHSKKCKNNTIGSLTYIQHMKQMHTYISLYMCMNILNSQTTLYVYSKRTGLRIMMDSWVLKKGGLQNYLETTLVPWRSMYVHRLHACMHGLVRESHFNHQVFLCHDSGEIPQCPHWRVARGTKRYLLRHNSMALFAVSKVSWCNSFSSVSQHRMGVTTLWTEARIFDVRKWVFALQATVERNCVK